MRKSAHGMQNQNPFGNLSNVVGQKEDVEVIPNACWNSKMAHV